MQSEVIIKRIQTHVRDTKTNGDCLLIIPIQFESEVVYYDIMAFRGLKPFKKDAYFS